MASKLHYLKHSSITLKHLGNLKRLFTKLANLMTEKTGKFRKPDHWQRWQQSDCSAVRCKATQHRAVCPKGRGKTELDTISSSSAPRNTKVLPPNLLGYKLAKDSGLPQSIVELRSKRGFGENLSWHGWVGDRVFRHIRDKQTLKQDNGHSPE